jgi:hypothetical protein
MAIKFGPQSPAEQAKEIVAKASASASASASADVVAALRAELAEPPKPKRTRAPNGTFDRKTYQRELMRKRRAAKSSASRSSP